MIVFCVLYSGINGTLVKCHTTALNGKAFVLEIKPDWAPLGAQRFLELVESGFFTDVSDMSRVSHVCTSGYPERECWCAEQARREAGSSLS